MTSAPARIGSPSVPHSQATPATAPNTTTTASPDTASTKSKRPSCLACRKIKVRCVLPPGAAPQSRCTRCIRINGECKYLPNQPPGRKPKTSLAAAAAARSGSDAANATVSTQPAQSPQSTHHQQQHQQPQQLQHPQYVASGHAGPSLAGNDYHNWYARVARNMPPQQPQQISHHPPTLPSQMPPSLSTLLAPSPTQPASSAMSVAESPGSTAQQQKSAHSPAAVHNNIDTLVEAAERRAAESEAAPAKRARQTSNASSSHLQQPQNPVLDAQQQRQQQPQQKSQQVVITPRTHHPIELQQMTLKSPDPVDLLILGEPEARHLFAYFMTELNPLIKILDPFLHTFEYVRSTSTALFTSMLTVASKYHRPDLHAALLNETQHLHGRGQTECQGGIGLVQGMAMLCYWKEPKDFTVWTKTGFIIRYGYTLRLHARRSTPLPEDELEARLVLDRERTWLNLICFERVARLYVEEDEDGAYVPSMVTIDDLDLDKWLKEGRSRGVGLPFDGLLCASVENSRINSLCIALQHTSSSSAALVLFRHVEHMLEESMRKYIQPMGPSAGEAPTPSYMQNRMSWGNVKCRARLAFYEAAGQSDYKALPLYLESVADTFDVCITSIERGSLDRVQDIFAVLLFRTAQSLAKLFPTVSFVHQTSIMTMLKSVYEACSKAAKGDDACASAYLKRFVRLVIRALTVNKSFPSSRAATPFADAEGNGQGVAPMVVGGLETREQQQQPSPHPIPAQTNQPHPNFAFQDVIGNIGPELVPELMQGNLNFDPMSGMQPLDAGFWESLLPASLSSLSWLDSHNGQH
ncbi:hypothetical protein ACM66B_000291 [Microbotryomycetes sp. NB124-2]